MNLWLDDFRKPWTHAPDRVWTWAKTAQEAIDWLKTGEVMFASLDHDLDICDECRCKPAAEVKPTLIRNPGCASYCSCPHTGTGYDVVLWMEANNVWPSEGVKVHSMNPVGRQRMEAAIMRWYGAVGSVA